MEIDSERNTITVAPDEMGIDSDGVMDSNEISVRTFRGRSDIYCGYPSLDNESNEVVCKVISDAFVSHSQLNYSDMRYLLDYYLGKHVPVINKVKSVRPEINSKVIVNIQKSIVRDTTGYFMGMPVQYVPRSAEKYEPVKKLCDAVELEHGVSVDKEIEDFCAIVGKGYKGIFFDSQPVNEVPFQLMSLSPLQTFSVLGTEFGRRPILICTYRSFFDADNKQFYRFVCYTNTKVYDITTQTPESIKANEVTVDANPIGLIPIIEYQNNMWNKGDIEDVLSLIDALDLLDSNNLDDVQQVVQSILLLFGIPKEQQEEIQEVAPNDLLMFTGTQGINQDGKYISPQVDVNGVTTLRDHIEEMIHVIAGIPDRKTRGGGGGDTGDAVKLRDGWADMELVARDKEKYWARAEQEAIAVMLKIMEIGGQKLDISTIDVSVKFARNKTDNMQSKAQSGATLYGMGMAKQDVLAAMDMTNDIAEVVKRWEEAEQEKRDRNMEQMQKQSDLALRNDAAKQKMSNDSKLQQQAQKAKDDKNAKEE